MNRYTAIAIVMWVNLAVESYFVLGRGLLGALAAFTAVPVIVSLIVIRPRG